MSRLAAVRRGRSVRAKISRVAVDMDIHGYIRGYIHGYIHVWISDFGNIHGYLWILMDIFM